MSQNASPQSPNANPNYNLTKCHADLIVEELPEPPETFYTDDLDEWAESIVQSLYRRDLIVLEGVDTIHTDSDKHEYKANEYRVKSVVYQDAEDVVAKRESVLPCGHPGFSNNGDTFTCSYDGCDKEFDRSEL